MKRLSYLLVTACIITSQANASQDYNPHEDTLLPPTPSVEGNPALRFGREVVVDAWNIGTEKFKTSKKLAKSAWTGDFSEFTGEALEAGIAYLCGQEAVNFMKDANQEFDKQLLNSFIKMAVPPLMGNFFAFLQESVMKQRGLYGLDKDGNEVAIYSKETLFHALASNYIPDFPGKNIIVSILEQSNIKSFMQAQLTVMATESLLSLLMSKNSPLKQRIGNFVSETGKAGAKAGVKAGVKGAKSALPLAKAVSVKIYEQVHHAIYGPSSEWPDISLSEEDPLFGYFAPTLNQMLRNFLIDSMSWGKNLTLNQVDNWVHGSFGLGVAGIVSGSGYLVGSTISSLSDYCLPFPLNVAGRMVGDSLPVMSYGASLFIGEAVFRKVKNKTDGALDWFIKDTSYSLVPYGKKEHLPKLNPNPSDFEKAYFFDDYKYAEEVNNISLVGEVIKRMTGLDYYNSNVESDDPLWVYFQENQNANVVGAFISNGIDAQLDPRALKRAFEQKKASRLLEMLKHEDLKQYKEQAELLLKYPSHRLYKKDNGLWKEDAHSSQRNGVENTREVVQNLLSAIDTLIKHEENIGTDKRKNLVKVIFEDLSVREQDLFIEYIDMLNSGKGLECEPVFDGGDDHLKHIKALIKEYVRESDAEFVEQNKDFLEELGSKSIAYGLDEEERIEVARELIENIDLTSKIFPAATEIADENEILHETYRDLIADYYGVQLARKWETAFKNAGVFNEVKSKFSEGEQVGYKAYRDAVSTTDSFNNINKKTDDFLAKQFGEDTDIVKKIEQKFTMETTAFLNKWKDEYNNSDLTEEKNTEQSNLSKSWFFTSWWGSSDNSEVVNGALINFSNLETVLPADLRLYDTGNLNKFKLLEFLKTKNFNEDLNLFVKDTSLIMNMITDDRVEKIKSLDRVYRDYFRDHGDEIKQRCLTSGIFDDQLFYSPTNMIAWVIQENKEIMNKLFGDQ
jgi:hypothetical protein